MSVFKAREWWSTVTGFEEFHTLGSLAVIETNLAGHDPPGPHAVLAIGSLAGFLRMYLPRPMSFEPEDLLLEQRMSGPVLQVASGKVLSDSADVGLIVLLPRALEVFSIVHNSDGPQLSLSRAYRHPLQRTSHSMAVGPFGKSSSQEMVCVQSMDGQLMVFSSTGLSFICFLPGFILPGPLLYVCRTDSFVTTDCNRQLVSYRYQSVMASAEMDVGGRNKKLTADWTVIIGEHAIDLKGISALDSPYFILVLGEHSVQCIRDTGAQLFFKKLECSSSCITPYSIHPPTEKTDWTVQYLLSTYSQQLLVMRNQITVWAALLHFPPVSLCVANFQELSGVIVTLDELGHLTCSYLGTDPTSLFPSLPPLSLVACEEAKKELAEIQSTIAEVEKRENNLEAEVALSLVASSEARPVEVTEGDGEEYERKQRCVEVKLVCSVERGSLPEVSLNVAVRAPISVHPQQLSLPASESGRAETQLTFVCGGFLMPATRQVMVTAMYSWDGAMRCMEQSSQLPLGLFCQACPPTKDQRHKVTLDTNQAAAVSLPALFPEFSWDGPPNALGFHLLCGSTVTIVASKYSEKYRMQSDSFPALGVFLDDFIDRLSQHCAGKKPAFKAQLAGSVPLTEYFELLEHHFKLRSQLHQCQQMLGRHSQQFRAIQKRLLARYRDKTPIGLAELDNLLDGTLMHLMALAEKSEQLQEQHLVASQELACGTHLLCLLLELTAHMEEEESTVLRSVLTSLTHPNSGQGWEEVTDAALTHILRTTLAKSAKERAVTMPPDLELPEDIQRLKRHVALLCDRISRGNKLATRPLNPAAANPVGDQLPYKSSLPTLQENEESDP